MTKSWHELSWDPNAPSVVAWQQGQLDHTMQTPVAHRLPYLRSIVRHKRVLDIGVVEHGVANEGGDAWLHRHLAQEAETILGVDILADAVAVGDRKHLHRALSQIRPGGNTNLYGGWNPGRCGCCVGDQWLERSNPRCVRGPDRG